MKRSRYSGGSLHFGDNLVICVSECFFAAILRRCRSSAVPKYNTFMCQPWLGIQLHFIFILRVHLLPAAIYIYSFYQSISIAA